MTARETGLRVCWIESRCRSGGVAALWERLNVLVGGRLGRTGGAPPPGDDRIRRFLEEEMRWAHAVEAQCRDETREGGA